MPSTPKILGQAVVGSTRTFNTINNKALTSNVATLTTASAHGYAVGNIVVVAGVDSTFDGTWVVASVPLTTTFTFMKTTGNVTSAAVSPVGIVYRTHAQGGVLSSNKYAVNGTCTATSGSAHGLAVNDWVRVTYGDTNMDGVVKVLAVPSTTTFTYQIAGAAVVTTALATGAHGRMTPTTWTELYAVPASTTATVSSILVANKGLVDAKFRIAFSTTTTPTDAETIAFDVPVSALDTAPYILGITLPAAKKIMVQANYPEIIFSAYGIEKT